jgi:hypothetical protein
MCTVIDLCRTYDVYTCTNHWSTAFVFKPHCEVSYDLLVLCTRNLDFMAIEIACRLQCFAFALSFHSVSSLASGLIAPA